MKDWAGFLDSEVNKLLVTRIIPGLTLVIPYLLLIARGSEPFRSAWVSFRVEFAVGFLLLASTVGLLIEDLGVLVENFHFKRLKKKIQDEKSVGSSEHKRDLTEEWYRYLRTSFDPEPAGVHYLKQMVMILKFEIHMGLALAFGSASVLWAPFPILWKGGSLLCLAFSSYTMAGHFASETVDHLATIRFELLKGTLRSTEETVGVAGYGFADQDRMLDQHPIASGRQ